VSIAVGIPVAAFSLLFPLTVSLPTWDQWDMVPVWEAYFTGHRVLPLLFAPYNGHFNVIPRAIFFLVGRMTSWNLGVEVVGAYLLCAASVCLLVNMLAEWDRRLLLLAAPFAALAFSFNQYEDLMTGIGLGQHLQNLAELLTIFWLTRREPSRNHFLAAAGSATIATFSWGVGVAAWPVGLIAVATSPGPKTRRVAIWIAGGGAALYAAQSAADSVDIYTVWSNVAPSFLVLLGNPFAFSAFPTLRTAVLLGAAAFAVFIVLCVIFWRVPSRRPFLRTWGLVGLLGLANGGLVAMARSTSPLENCLRSHYITAVFFAGLAILALCSRGLLDLSDTGGGRRKFAALAGLAAVCAFAMSQVVTVSATGWYPTLSSWAVTVEDNSRKIMAGTATDQEIRQSHYPKPADVRKYVEVLRRYRLAAFAEEPGQRGLPGSRP